jgi:RecB family exonuclease
MIGISMPKHISISQINKYLGCGEAYRLQYIEGIKQPPNISMIKGLAFHKAAETNNLQKKKSKQDLCVDELKEIASNDLDLRLSSEVWYKTKEKENITKTKGDAKDSLIIAIDQLANQTKDVIPVEIEAEFTIEIPGIDKPLKAVIDCITDDQRVIDYKVTSKPKKQIETDVDIQLMAYALIYRVNYGVFPQTEFHNYTAKHTKTYGHETIFNKLSIYHNENSITPLINTLKVVTESIEKGIFMPAAKDMGKPFYCSPDQCMHYHSCKYINGKSRFGI